MQTTGKTQQQLLDENIANIDSWKEKHKRVKVITVKSKLLKRDVPFIIGKPTTQVLDAVAKYDHDGKTKKVEEVLIGSCVLAGEVALFNEDLDVKNAVMEKVNELFDKLEVEEKEL